MKHILLLGLMLFSAPLFAAPASAELSDSFLRQDLFAPGNAAMQTEYLKTLNFVPVAPSKIFFTRAKRLDTLFNFPIIRAVAEYRDQRFQQFTFCLYEAGTPSAGSHAVRLLERITTALNTATGTLPQTFSRTNCSQHVWLLPDRYWQLSAYHVSDDPAKTLCINLTLAPRAEEMSFVDYQRKQHQNALHLRASDPYLTDQKECKLVSIPSFFRPEHCDEMTALLTQLTHYYACEADVCDLLLPFAALDPSYTSPRERFFGRMHFFTQRFDFQEISIDSPIYCDRLRYLSRTIAQYNRFARFSNMLCHPRDEAFLPEFCDGAVLRAAFADLYATRNFFDLVKKTVDQREPILVYMVSGIYAENGKLPAKKSRVYRLVTGYKAAEPNNPKSVDRVCIRDLYTEKWMNAQDLLAASIFIVELKKKAEK